MTIAVDFDGTISTGTFPEVGIPMPYSVEVIREWYKEGHYIIIWTCRTGDDLLRMVNYLKDYNIPFDRVNANHPDDIEFYGGDTRKVNADVYIDDRQVGGLPSWNEIREYVKNLKNK